MRLSSSLPRASHVLKFDIGILEDDADEILDGIRDLGLRQELPKQDHAVKTLNSCQSQCVVLVRRQQCIGEELKEAILECEKRRNKVRVVYR